MVSRRWVAGGVGMGGGGPPAGWAYAGALGTMPAPGSASPSARTLRVKTRLLCMPCSMRVVLPRRSYAEIPILSRLMTGCFGAAAQTALGTLQGDTRLAHK